MRKVILGIAGFLTFAGLGSPANAVEVSVSCGAFGVDLQLCTAASQRWAAQTGNTVQIVSAPVNDSDRLPLYQQMLAAHSSDIDIYQIDVIWPGILGSHFIDLKPYSNGTEKDHFPAIVKNNTVNGQLLAMPWYTDAGVLYYRKDLLEKYGAAVPQTWDELTETATKIQEAERSAGNKQMWGFVWQGKADEGLTCDAFEWVFSHGGGSIVEPDGRISINNAKAAKAIDLAASWIGKISPTSTLNDAEEESRGIFQTGNAVFMRNWPYAWSLANSADSPVRDRVGVAILPQGGANGIHTAVLGGWQLAVSKYSKHPKEAAELVMYLTSSDGEKERAIKGSYNPTRPDLYKDPEVLSAVPFFGTLYETFANAEARPSGVTKDRYNQVSVAFLQAVHSVLSGQEAAAPALNNLETSINDIQGSSW
ncbi:ABC transporter substrate-binding protein [Phyllobacterium chamaecytisi]|uniref:ABC transporter substrate-binding protein n=1 Tax=Phyllobacterium chamaecytisi TaxID=2876082 RepID=UPI001CCAA87F|nr:ABC transporter substrate-binding protein [Phyllobacterium sp. KW56]MBZ9603143.1 ABC transporter substrate-binding protein [Phyllobacterium sp. KW56]